MSFEIVIVRYLFADLGVIPRLIQLSFYLKTENQLP